MIWTLVLVALNALVWGLWVRVFVEGGTHGFEQAAWYVYGPSAVLLIALLAPVVLLLTRRLGPGTPRNWLRVILVFTLLGFFPYACMSGGGV